MDIKGDNSKNHKQQQTTDTQPSSGANPLNEPRKIYTTSDLGRGHQSLKAHLSLRLINKIYGKVKYEYRYERLFWWGSRLFLPLIIIILFVIAVVGVFLNFYNVSDKLIRFGTTSADTSANKVTVSINANMWAETAYKNKFLNYKKSTGFTFNYFESSALTKKLWGDIKTEFDAIYQNINNFAKQHHIILKHRKNNPFKKDDYPSNFQKILNSGIDFFALPMKYYHPQSLPIDSTVNHLVTTPDPTNPDYYKSLYVPPLQTRNNITNDTLLLPVPAYIFTIDSYYKSYSSQSDFIKSFEKETNTFVRGINNKSGPNLNYFWNQRFDNSASNGNSNITGILPVYNVTVTTHNKSVLYFKATMLSITIIFLILLIYLFFRYGLNNVFALLISAIGLLFFLFPLLTLAFPIGIPAYTILILMVILFLFNGGYFIHRAAAHLRIYEKHSHFVFAKKNDLKKIAFDVLFSMKRLLLFEIITFFCLGLLFVIAFSLPIFHGDNMYEFIGYGVSLCFATLAMVAIFIFSFIYFWILTTYYYLNTKKTYVINAILYQKKSNNEQVVPGINDYWEEINLRRLYHLNPELQAALGGKDINDEDYDIEAPNQLQADDKIKGENMKNTHDSESEYQMQKDNFNNDKIVTPLTPTHLTDPPLPIVDINDEEIAKSTHVIPSSVRPIDLHISRTSRKQVVPTPQVSRSRKQQLVVISETNVSKTHSPNQDQQLKKSHKFVAPKKAPTKKKAIAQSKIMGGDVKSPN